jgi:hypothetical protein
MEAQRLSISGVFSFFIREVSEDEMRIEMASPGFCQEYFFKNPLPPHLSSLFRLQPAEEAVSQVCVSIYKLGDETTGTET